jgi:hypothetical protein
MIEHPSTPKEYVASSYRYLRLGMVILVVTLGVSIVIERAKASCWQGSISAYYYTPVHSLFVGALVAIGVTLVAMRGKDSLEDLFFNVAGVLAPIVALVPTSRPSVVCSRAGDELTTRTTALVSNNVPALVVAVALAIVLAFVIAQFRPGREGRVGLPLPSIIVLVIGTVLLVAGFIWYQSSTENFEQYAHGSTAVAMFVFIWFAVLLNGGWPKSLWRRAYQLVGEKIPTHTPDDRERKFRTWYRAVAAFMFVAGLGVVLTAPLGIEWEHKVFWLEALEIVPFAIFWTLQTFEAWDDGVVAPTSVAMAA